MQTFYEQQLAKKTSWKVIKGDSGAVMPGSERTIARALELRILELEVAEFLKDGSSRELARLTPDVMAVLQSNIDDEVKHDEALNHAALMYNLATSQETADAKAIAQEWITHPDHPIAKTAVLESSVFFVLLPIFRFLTAKGGCLKATSQDISNDENIHAAVHRQLAKDLGLAISPSLNKLRRETIDWMLADLNSPGKWGNRELWMRSSDSLFDRGIAPELAATGAFSMPAFFEIRNDNLPSYG